MAEAGKRISEESQTAADAQPRRPGVYTEKEQKTAFLYVVIAIVLLEFAATVGAIVYSITNAERSASGMMRFNFPWLEFLIMAALIPVLVMLVLHVVRLGLNHGNEGEHLDAAVGGRVATFFALVRGAPSVILFTGLVLLGAAIYYLDGVMALLLKLGDSFDTVAVWGIGALAAVLCVNAVARAVFAYKTRQLEAEYAFRREVLEKTGTVLLDARLASTTQIHQLMPGNVVDSSAHDVCVLPAVHDEIESREESDHGQDQNADDTRTAVHAEGNTDEINQETGKPEKVREGH